MHNSLRRWRRYVWWLAALLVAGLFLPAVAATRAYAAGGVQESGLVWTSRATGSSAWLHGIAAGAGRIVAVGDSGTILVSSGGNSWAARSSGTSKHLADVAYGNGLFVAVGQEGTILTSADGDRWSASKSGIEHHINRIAFGQGRFVAVGDSGTILTSTDGTTWTAASSVPDTKLSGVAVGGGRFVVVGYSGTVFTSADGQSWTKRSAGTAKYLSGVAYGNGLFLAVGQDDLIMTSADGSAWKSHAVDGMGGLGLWSVAFGDGQFMAVGGIGNILSTTDGASWVRHDKGGVFAFLDDVAYMGGQFVTVGHQGTIRTSGAGALTVAPAPEGVPAGEQPAPPTEPAKTAPPPAPVTCESGKIAGPRTERTIAGGLTVQADAAGKTKDGKEELCGNLTINQYLKVDGKITFDPQMLEVSGEGTIYVETPVPHFPGTIQLYSGEFALDADVTELFTNEKGQSKLELAQMSVEIKRIKLLQGGVQVKGVLALPEFAGGGKVKVDDLRIMQGKVQALDLTLPDLAVGKTIMTLEDARIKYDADADLFEGEGTLTIPKLFGIDAALGVKGGRLNRVGFGLSGLRMPIDGSGFFVSRIYGELDGLTDLTKLKIIAETDVYGGPQIGNFHAILAEDLRLEIDVSGYVRGSGTLHLVQLVDLEGSLEFNWAQSYALVKASLNAFDMILGNAEIKIEGDREFYGRFAATLKVPEYVPLVGGDEVGGSEVSVDNSGFEGSAKIADSVKVKCSVDWEGDFDCDWSIKLWGKWAGLVPVVAAVGEVAIAPPAGQFTMPAGMENAIVVLNWDAGDADFSLTAPDGKVITPASATSDSLYYQKHSGRREAFYLIMNPTPGTWRYSVEARGAATFEVQLLSASGEPTFEVTAPAMDAAASGPIHVRWQSDAPAGSKVSLFYATNRDELGVRFAADLDASLGAYSWTPDGLPSGTYYIQAVLSGSAFTSVRSVASGRVTYRNVAAPAAPRGLTVRAVNGNLELSWQANTEADLAGYRVYVGDQFVALGRETSYAWSGLAPGKSYQVAVTAYDTDWHESERSSTASVFLTQPSPPALSVTWPGETVTNRPTVTVRGQIEAGATGTLYLDEQPVATNLTGSFQQQVTLDAGRNRLRVVAVKPGGDAAVNEHEIYLDAIAPQLTVDGLTASMQVTTGSLRVAGRTEPGARLTLNGKAVPVGQDGRFATNLILAQGVNHVELVARDQAGNTMTFSGTVTSTTAGSAVACGTLFPDVGGIHPACGAVEQLAAMDVIKGYPDGSFQPDRGVTRAEFAKMLVVALGRAPRPQAQLSFRDVSGHWAASGGYLQTAVDLQAIVGFPDGSFKPDDPVTRAQVVKIVAAAAGLNPAGRAPYADIPAGAWYEGWAGTAFQAKFIGTGAPVPVWTGSTLQGDKAATRAEAAMVLANLLNARR